MDGKSREIFIDGLSVTEVRAVVLRAPGVGLTEDDGPMGAGVLRVRPNDAADGAAGADFTRWPVIAEISRVPGEETYSPRGPDDRMRLILLLEELREAGGRAVVVSDPGEELRFLGGVLLLRESELRVVRFPAVRAGIVAAVRALAASGPPADDLAAHLRVLHDTCVLPDPTAAIGDYLRSTEEAAALMPLKHALDGAHPTVAEAARTALAALAAHPPSADIDLGGVEEPWVVFAPSASSFADTQVRSVESRGGRVHHLQAQDLLDDAGVFRAFSTALSFHGYFGWNWDAMIDCLGDLCAAATDHVAALCVIHAADALTDPEHVQLLISSLVYGAERSCLDYDDLGESVYGPPVPLNFLFLLDSTTPADLATRLTGRTDLVVSETDDLVTVTLHPDEWATSWRRDSRARPRMSSANAAPVTTVSEVRFVEMRAEIISAVHALADVEYQQRVWVRREYPHENVYDDFGTNVHILCDDTSVLENPFGAVGVFLRSAEEAEALLPLRTAMDGLLDQLGGQLEDIQYIESPLWPPVVAAAKTALVALTSSETDHR
ncbi:barstar family protein [Actinokineospora guangxiensis]|uniref:Barstar family protein n=1 Tax=Actinokineospora guangxiensis TaxID=1490288 RepID=A0ABW0EWD3_9PSEU